MKGLTEDQKKIHFNAKEDEKDWFYLYYKLMNNFTKKQMSHIIIGFIWKDRRLVKKLEEIHRRFQENKIKK